MCSFMVKFLFAELDHKVTEAIFQTSISFFLLTAILLGYKVTETSCVLPSLSQVVAGLLALL
jgi:hypothetical protein